MIGNDPSFSIVELWLCKDTFPTLLHEEVVAAVNRFQLISELHVKRFLDMYRHTKPIAITLILLSG